MAPGEGLDGVPELDCSPVPGGDLVGVDGRQAVDVEDGSDLEARGAAEDVAEPGLGDGSVSVDAGDPVEWVAVLVGVTATPHDDAVAAHLVGVQRAAVEVDDQGGHRQQVAQVHRVQVEA